MAEKRKFSFFLGLMRILTYVAAIFLFVSYFSQMISPEKVKSIALVGLFYPLLFVVNVLFVFYWLYKKKKMVMLPAVVLILGFNLPLKYFNVGSSEELQSQEECLKIMTYNVKEFGAFDAQKNGFDSRMKDFVGFFKKQNPDILCLQEFYSRRDKSSYNTFKILDDALKYPYIYYEKYNEKTHNIYFVVLSKYPLIKKNLIDKASHNKDHTGLYVDVNFNGSIFRLYNIHLNSTNLSSQVNYLETDYDLTEEKDIKKAAKGAKVISSRLMNAFALRSFQVKELKDLFKNSPYPYVVVGDFNDPPCSYSYNTLSAGLKDSFLESGSGFSTTYNGPYPSFRIDYILHDEQISAFNYKRYKQKLSDHYAVSALLNFSNFGGNEE